MPAGSTTKWGPEIHQDVLIALLEHITLTREQWSGTMAALHSVGYTFTESALRYVIQHYFSFANGLSLPIG